MTKVMGCKMQENRKSFSIQKTNVINLSSPMFSPQNKNFKLTMELSPKICLNKKIAVKRSKKSTKAFVGLRNLIGILLAFICLCILFACKDEKKPNNLVPINTDGKSVESTHENSLDGQSATRKEQELKLIGKWKLTSAKYAPWASTYEFFAGNKYLDVTVYNETNKTLIIEGNYKIQNGTLFLVSKSSPEMSVNYSLNVLSDDKFLLTGRDGNVIVYQRKK